MGVAACKPGCCGKPENGQGDTILTAGGKPVLGGEASLSPKEEDTAKEKEKPNGKGKAKEATNGNSLSIFRAALKKSFSNPQTAFDMLDKDGSHNVSKDEWLAALAEMGKKQKWDATTTDVVDKFGASFFDQMDIDGGGNIEFEEFKKGLVQKLDPAARNKHLVKFRAALNKKFTNPKDAFDLLDPSGNGTVTREEWMSCISDLGKAVKWDKGCLELGEAFFDEMDKDQGGEIDLKEFEEALTNTLNVDMTDAELQHFRSLVKKGFKKPQDAFDMLGGVKNKKVKEADKKVTKEDWMDCLQEVGMKLKWGPKDMKMIGQFGESFFDKMDVDGDGSLGFAEFKKSLVHTLEPPKGCMNLSKFRAAMKKSVKDPKELFEMLDKNGNKSVCKEEWCECLHEIGVKFKWDEDTLRFCEESGAGIFESMDTDGSNDLNIDEFMEQLAKELDDTIHPDSIKKFQSLMKKGFKNPKDAFDKLDKFGKKTISKEDWMTCLEETGKSQKWPAEDIDLCNKFGDKFFDQMDQGGDGHLEFAEFKKALGKKL